MYADGIAEAIDTPIPDVLHQFLLTDRPPLMQEQIFQHAAFLPRQGERLAVYGGDAALGIKGKPPAAQTDIPLDELPPGQAANARLKLRQMEGLGEIVVCAGVQPVHLIRNLAARGENQHAGFKVALAKRAQDGHAVHLGQVQIQQNQIVLLGR